MAALSNPRHERFSQWLAKGHSASEAYEKAGYKPNRQAASRLLSKVDVQRRTRELQDVGAQRAEMSFEGHLRKLEELRDKAHASGQHSAAIRAEELRGRAYGYYVERHEVEQHTITDDPMRPEDWTQQYTDATH